jgi:two-component system sensor histidine kinase CpxA
MKSLYLKITLWIAVAFVLSVTASFYTLGSLNRTFTGRQANSMTRMVDWQFDQAVSAYENGGREGLDRFMTELKKHFSAGHYVVDAKTNRDLLTGEDRSALAASATGPPRIPFLPGGPQRRFLIARERPDGKYRYLVQVDPPFNQTSALLPLALIFLFLSVFSYGLFRYLASPLRQLSEAVERFGQGDLAARVNVKRSDEIGALGARYNEMADRIQTLLAAERRLLEDVSHELRSPLARMQFALAAVKTAKDPEQAIARLRKEIDRLGELVGYLLEVTRAEGDPAARARESVDLRALVEMIVEDSRIEADAKDCELELAAAEPLVSLADRELLRRAFENVIRNAIRYAPEHSKISISLVKKAGEAVLQVRDAGPGVPEEMLGKIFQPFFRVDSSRTAATGGVGLGLAIAQRAVALHQGAVSAENANPGLRVKIEIPLAA